MVQTEATADDSLAAMRARRRFGIAIAAMMRMIATTISNSISEKPFCLRIFPLGCFQPAIDFPGSTLSRISEPTVWDVTGHFPRPARRRAYCNPFCPRKGAQKWRTAGLHSTRLQRQERARGSGLHGGDQILPAEEWTVAAKNAEIPSQYSGGHTCWAAAVCGMPEQIPLAVNACFGITKAARRESGLVAACDSDTICHVPVHSLSFRRVVILRSKQPRLKACKKTKE